MSEQDVDWKIPVAGFEYKSETVTVTALEQAEKLALCGLSETPLQGFVDASFFIALGIKAGINSGISAEGNVNMLQTLIQHRPVVLGEALTVKGYISKVTDVPRGITIDTETWFEDSTGNKVISTPRRSLKPDPEKKQAPGAGNRPAAVIENPGLLETLANYQLTPEAVTAFTQQGNSIHYNMQAANKAGFRAPIIGGGMGVSFLLNSLWAKYRPHFFDISIYFRRPIFWDDTFCVAADTSSEHWPSICLAKQGKVLTEARINSLVAGH